MIGTEIDARNGEELVRFVRALGQHRYVASRLHLVHVFAIEAAGLGGDPALADARAWADLVLADDAIDVASKDERLYRAVTDAELAAVLGAFWGSEGASAAITLGMRLAMIGVMPALDALPFEEDTEEEMFPVLVDAGWELLPLRSLEPERHRGAMAAFGDALAFDIAKFEEENAVPEPVTLHELPALGATELLLALDNDGGLRAPFVLWSSGQPTYVDYVLRGVLKIAKLADR